MDIKNNALIHNPDLAKELAKRLGVVDVEMEPAGMRQAKAQDGDIGYIEPQPVTETAGAAGLITATDPEPRRQPANFNPTKSPYNFQRERARRKQARRSRKINRGR